MFRLLMTARTVIHVGLPKTGSAFLQRAVFPRLAQTHFSNKASRRLRRLLYNNDTINHKRLVRLAESLRGHERVLISNEGPIGEPQRSFQYHHGVAVRLTELFPGAEILLLIRRQDRYVESMYRQVIQQGWFHPLEEFILRKKDREHRRWYPATRGPNELIPPLMPLPDRSGSPAAPEGIRPGRPRPREEPPPPRA